MNCKDSTGTYLTYNDKPRDCEWLDNGYNGAKSDRKDMNCLSSDIGDNCRYTCRLYNGCIDFLLSAVNNFIETDVSIGDSCADKPGVFMGNNHIPRNCTWIEEDPNTAPMKKNLNCGTPDDPRTELGVMCPASCAGYNECGRDGKKKDDGTVQNALPHPDANFEFKNDGLVDDDAENPTLAPTFGVSGEPTIWSTDTPTVWETATPTYGATEKSCVDKDGEFLTHMGTYRACRWFNRDDIEEKKRLNCHSTEIGLNCEETCGCLPSVMGEEVKPTVCIDPNGPFETHEGETRQCEWLDRGDVSERKELNCGITEIGLNCICRCPMSGHDPSQNVLIQDVSWDYSGNDWDYASVTSRPTPTPPTKTEGILDDTKEIMTLIPSADTTVALRNAKDNFGESLVLRVSDADNAMQSLLLFDLSLIAKKFMGVGNAVLQLYATVGSSDGGVVFKKMKTSDWKEEEVSWSNMPGGEGSDELVVAFLNDVRADAWYDVDVTAALRDALANGEPYLSIRIVSDFAKLSFASKERGDESPQLIVDSRTIAPTNHPSGGPTGTPTSSPAVTLDCTDHKGKFITHTGQSQSCSWFDIGNGMLKKELNCQGGKEASLFCQAQCGEFNGCDDLTCEDRSGSYLTHSGWTAECSWLLTGQGTMKLEQNCGTDQYPITDLGKRCQATCGDYNGCNES